MSKEEFTIRDINQKMESKTFPPEKFPYEEEMLQLLGKSNKIHLLPKDETERLLSEQFIYTTSTKMYDCVFAKRVDGAYLTSISFRCKLI